MDDAMDVISMLRELNRLGSAGPLEFFEGEIRLSLLRMPEGGYCVIDEVDATMQEEMMAAGAVEILSICYVTTGVDLMVDQTSLVKKGLCEWRGNLLTLLGGYTEQQLIADIKAMYEKACRS